MTQLILSALGLLPNIFLAYVGIHYVSRRPGPDSAMLATGTCLLLLLGMFNLVYWQLIMPARGFSNSLIPQEVMSAVITMSYFVAETLIGIGLLLLVKKELRRSKESSFGPPMV
ncbi:MAG: hypothetical protein ABI432_17355 [Flavobacteriales bacterium]